LELRLLANSFSLYFDAAVTCNREGTSVEVGNQGYKQVSPDYVVMKTEYKNITTHAAKFGLNPADLKRVFDKLEDDKKTVKKGFETGPMKVAK
jgi:phage terminase small subunit